MTIRRGRPLTREERQLWAAVARAVQPLPGRLAPPEEAAPQGPARPEPKAAATTQAPFRAPLPKPTLPPIAPLERRTLRALSRGAAAIEGVLDLHGLRQADAHAALRRFLAHSQAGGRRIVLVITGKGAAGAPDMGFAERGVLRRAVPQWLRLPDLRPLVLGFEPAAPHQGGEGALYVRLRRSRPG